MLHFTKRINISLCLSSFLYPKYNTNTQTKTNNISQMYLNFVSFFRKKNKSINHELDFEIEWSAGCLSDGMSD